jgi:hypothetical protein
MSSDIDRLLLLESMFCWLFGCFRHATCTWQVDGLPLYMYGMILLLPLQGDTDEDVPAGGFHMGLMEKGRSTSGPGFSLKF